MKKLICATLIALFLLGGLAIPGTGNALSNTQALAGEGGRGGGGRPD